MRREHAVELEELREVEHALDAVVESQTQAVSAANRTAALTSSRVNPGHAARMVSTEYSGDTKRTISATGTPRTHG